MITSLRFKTYLLCAQIVLVSTGLFASDDMFSTDLENIYSSSPKSLSSRYTESLVMSEKTQSIEIEDVVADIEKEIDIDTRDGVLQLSETFIDLLGENFTYKLNGFTDIEGLQIFVRDNSIIKFDKKTQIFSAIKSGSTEVVFVAEGQMIIIPAKVGKEFKAPTFAVNESFVQVEASYSAPRKVVTIEDAEAQVDATFAYESSKNKFSFSDLNAKNSTADLTLQVIDERSSIEQDKIYPVVGIDVRIIGSRKSLRTDARGIVQFSDLPANGRVIIETFDSSGLYIASKSEAIVEPGGVTRLKVLSAKKFMFMSEISGRSFDTNYGSVCFNLMDGDGAAKQSNLSISINTQESNPIYWGQYGPDMGAVATSASGRVCYMNLEDGIHEFTVRDSDGIYSGFTYPVFSGYHNEEDIHLENAVEVSINLASLATANEQLYSNEDDASAIRAVDDGNIIELGLNDNLEKIGIGSYKLINSTNIKGRRYILNRSPEFADTIHTLDEARSNTLTLVHRGFFEDLFHELYLDSDGPSVAYDQALAQMMLQYHNRDEEDVKFSVVDANGKEVETGWFLPESSGIHKAVFFNLSPGIYQVIAKSTDGSWLDASTIAVDYWTNTVVNLGSKIQIDNTGLD